MCDASAHSQRDLAKFPCTPLCSVVQDEYTELATNSVRWVLHGLPCFFYKTMFRNLKHFVEKKFKNTLYWYNITLTLLMVTVEIHGGLIFKIITPFSTHVFIHLAHFWRMALWLSLGDLGKWFMPVSNDSFSKTFSLISFSHKHVHFLLIFP